MTHMPRFNNHLADNAHKYPNPISSDLLVEQSHNGLSQLLSKIELVAPEASYKERLETELTIIVEKGVEDYFLIVADYVQWAKSNGIAVGPGRGSGPCSLVGFALGITNVDPLRYNLPFERFVNPDRNVLPDFDLDFCDLRSGEVRAYIQSKYGADSVAQISSDNAFPLPSRLVIGDRPLAELVPLYPNAVSGFLATELTVAQIADAGLVQFNVINQKALTVIHRRVKELEKSNTVVDIDNIVLDNSATYRLLCTGVASDINEFDGEHYSATLNAIQPNNFEHLCAVIAQCFPRFQDSLPLYLDRKLDRKRNSALTDYFHPALKSILADTYGVILYQEQLMHITHKIAGFSMAQGDQFRRALKSNHRQAIVEYKNRFIAGATNNGLSALESSDLFDHIVQTGKNTFTKSHAVAFAMLAYQSAWLKANYPEER